ncbi:breast carcinoma-amplified sequence 1 isoform X3 [Phyllopteryx taeniolatus]|uniref:breast carcinoma-amplified sequence 1 isoform X3 n=1 Tax=Phyllopteryx taeniolatus TaxID=161469 RepID=UPI002AD1E1DB|nr:breast carcinoma-amplified sequence 1 isoform X3 [Phyllopteryx taeniolatus]
MGNEHSKNKDPSKLNQCDKNGGLNALTGNNTSNGLEIDVNSLTQNQQNGKAAALNPATESEYVVVQSDSQDAESEDVPEKLAATPQREEAEKHEGKVQLFDKIFKKKGETDAPVDAESITEEETHKNIARDANLPCTDTLLETANQKPEALTEPEQTDNANSPPTEEETNLEESPVMNFFKNLNLTVTVPSLVRQMSSTKTSKKETPEVPKDQRQRENQSAPTTTVVQVSDPPAASKGMVIPPPPPPPELPKLEVKAEPSGKPAKPTTSKEKTKAAPKSVESSKGKSTKDVLSKFFRPKTNKETQLQAIEAEVYPIVEKEDTPVDVPEAVVEVKAEEPQQTPEEATQMVVDEKFTVEGPQPEKVDPCKGGTLEAPAKPEPPALVHEEKKTPSKSPFFSLFKPKASDPKKASPAPAKAADALPTVKVKEESKAAVKSCEVIIDDKVASVAPKAVDSAANAARKSEKRNSIQLFLKHLGQKRHSTDAGVQTEPVTVAPAAK